VLRPATSGSPEDDRVVSAAIVATARAGAATTSATPTAPTAAVHSRPIAWVRTSP
jgi:hypothetical protein